jgi:hypothetical protein
MHALVLIAAGLVGEPGVPPDGYDLELAARRVSLDVCGRSPSAGTTIDDPDALRALLSQCLDSEHWRAKDGVLWNLANPKIRPLQAIKAGADEGAVPLADYEDDYNLYVYAMTDDRDVRTLLLSPAIVQREDGPPTIYRAVERGPLADIVERGADVAQLIPPDRRAGMLTTRWNLASNTMFTAIPRTTAAQAYRAYLGLDLALLQGVVPVEGEPFDYDAKDVEAPACAVCHSTLDPLTYPFAFYHGIGGGLPRATPFTYVADRPERFEATDGPDVGRTPEAGVLLGQPVADLIEWAEVAANSDAFARTITADLWRLLVGTAPEGDPEFEQVWPRLASAHAYRVEGTIADIVFTEAYGGL